MEKKEKTLKQIIKRISKLLQIQNSPILSNLFQIKLEFFSLSIHFNRYYLFRSHVILK